MESAMADKPKRQTKRQTNSKASTKAAKTGRPKKARGAANSSDAADARWTVRGVPSNVRDMATKAAKSRGMTVGDWLAEIIVQSARKGLSADEKKNVPAVLTPDLIDLVQTMNERLTMMEENQNQGVLKRLFGRQNGRQEKAA
jgi:hypothetical protein